ncbi:MAG TPA: crotonase/enoyl-CoA hydratase family protein [Nevskiaceae bacterium]|nr:crotonase/enoyl-CoA hydratase family protein [Nevskiaceae bacterium]
MSLCTYQHENGVATIAMDDGKVNALSPAMQGEINAAIDRAEADKAIIILTGRTGVFSGGFDLKVLRGGGDAMGMLKGGFELAARLLTYPRPVIGACNGHAIAMGAFLMQSVDYRLGVDGAFKIVANEVAIGLVLPHPAIELLRARLHPAHYQRAMLLSEMYTPADAVAAGFLDRVVPEAQLMDEARKLAADFGKLDRAAHKGTKERVRGPLAKTIREMLKSEGAF